MVPSYPNCCRSQHTYDVVIVVVVVSSPRIALAIVLGPPPVVRRCRYEFWPSLYRTTMESTSARHAAKCNHSKLWDYSRPTSELLSSYQTGNADQVQKFEFYHASATTTHVDEKRRLLLLHTPVQVQDNNTVFTQSKRVELFTTCKLGKTGCPDHTTKLSPWRGDSSARGWNLMTTEVCIALSFCLITFSD